MIQNWIQMKGTDANISCTKFEWIWKTWVFIWYLASRFRFTIAWLLFWRNFHRAQMIQNWVQMKGTDANVSCTKFERIWKTWVFKRFIASRFTFMIVWLQIWPIFHRARMIQNWVQMKGTDANVSCTKFEWIWKAWGFKRELGQA